MRMRFAIAAVVFGIVFSFGAVEAAQLGAAPIQTAGYNEPN
jgi:hypothetical protein